MGAYDIEDAMAWKKKIELIIDQVWYLFSPCFRLQPVFTNIYTTNAPNMSTNHRVRI
jgi:hypothetical protein